MREPDPKPRGASARTAVLATLALGLLLAPGCSPPPTSTDESAGPTYKEMAAQFPNFERYRFNYFLDARKVRAAGFSLPEVEARLDDIFRRYSPAEDFKKSRSGHSILYQCKRFVPDFGIMIIAERDGRHYGPADFGSIMLTPND